MIDLSAILLMLLAVVLSGCSKPQVDNEKHLESTDSIIRERAAKDEAFKSGQESPIPIEERSSFRGLSYYPVDPALALSVELHRYPMPKQIKLATNTGEIRRGLRYGYFDFQVSNQNCQLQVYRLEEMTGNTASLFIPFRDSTSGSETYAAGRYIDLVENTSGIYELNFNNAYNPYCAYNSEFSCPIPPAENKLSVPIRAGEKKYLSPGKK